MTMQNPLKNIPSVNELLESPPLRRLVDRANRNVVVSGVRSFLDNMRGEVQSVAAEIHVPSPVELAERIAEWILSEQQSPLRHAINATGAVLHGELGRAPLANEALQAITEIASGYASVDYDLESGEPSDRLEAVEKLLRERTGAEAALVVSNRAAAALLAISAIAAGREVVVSRGQVVENADYRLTDIVSTAGARLREVGATNKTRIEDYNAAIGTETAALLCLEAAEYAIVGAAAQAALTDLAMLARKRNVPLLADLGCGGLLDAGKYGLAGLPTAGESLKAGADVVLLSGDLLLGGPGCGILLGRKPLIQKMASHPLMRTAQADKLTLAALAATLALYRDEESAEQAVPVLMLLSISPENLRHRAEHMAPQLAAVDNIAEAEPVEGEAYLTENALPSQKVATWSVAVRPARGSVESLARRLRTGRPAVIGRIEQYRLVFDLRSVLPSQDMQIVAAVDALAAVSSSDKDGHAATQGDALPDAE